MIRHSWLMIDSWPLLKAARRLDLLMYLHYLDKSYPNQKAFQNPKFPRHQRYLHHRMNNKSLRYLHQRRNNHNLRYQHQLRNNETLKFRHHLKYQYRLTRNASLKHLRRNLKRRPQNQTRLRQSRHRQALTNEQTGQDPRVVLPPRLRFLV